MQEKYPHIKAQEVSESNEEQKEDDDEIAKVEAEYQNEHKVVLSDATQEEKEFAIEYVNNNYWSHYVNRQFIDNYPAEKDVPFWVNVINRDAGINQNYRAFKKELMGRIMERNGQSLDKVVGMGVFPEINCEQDYVYQYFMFGIVGLCLIVGIYFVIFGKNVITFFVRFKKYWNAEFMAYMCAFAIALLLPYVTGHMLGNTLVMFQIVLLTVIVEATAKRIKLQKK